MTWTAGAILALIAFAGAALVFLFFARQGEPALAGAPGKATSKPEPASPPSAPAEAAAAQPKAAPTPTPQPSRPSLVSVPRLAAEDFDDDSDLTVVTLGPVGKSGLATIPRFDDEDEDVPVPTPEAVPILFEADAADEPTRAKELILVSAVGQTDRGQVRPKNEDAYSILEAHDLFVIADGMGGHRGGEIASQIAVETIKNAFEKNAFEGEDYPSVPKRGAEVARAIQMANANIFAKAQAEFALSGMGTTIVAARFAKRKQRLYIGHVGDSRCYRLRGGELKQITTDHTMSAVGLSGPLGERLQRAVGIQAAVKVDVVMARPQPGDLYMLCSDGLTKMVPHADLTTALAGEQDMQRGVAKLIEMANAGGGKDNVTVILVSVRPPVDVTR
ncbi:MAG: protein phosphatase 2C domain-containing protein [Polyangiaceae bacterium]